MLRKDFNKKIEAARRLEAVLDLNLSVSERKRRIKPGSCEQCREPVRVVHRYLQVGSSQVYVRGYRCKICGTQEYQSSWNPACWLLNLLKYIVNP